MEMDEDGVRQALGRWAETALVKALARITLEEPWELWEPKDWLPLDEALAGWDTSGPVGTQTDGPYVGPRGLGIAGDAAEDMICLLEGEAGHLVPELVKWDQMVGRFEPMRRLLGS